MSIERGIVLVAALAIAACGGGGGGDAGSGGGNGGGGTGGGGGSGGVEPNGTAEIVFPWTHSAATSPTLTVRGIASDPDGVASVSVNGAAATIVARGSASLQKPSAKGALAEGEVEWEAEVPLASGENEVTVSVEDDGGEVSESADSATITYVEVPVWFSLDMAGARVVGLSYTLSPTGYVQHLVEHNYETLEQTVYDGQIFADPATSCFRSVEDEFLYLSFFTGTWELRKFDLETAQDTLLFPIPDERWDPGTGFENLPFVWRLVCGGTHTSAYVLANYRNDMGEGHSPDANFAKTRVLEIDLATGDVTTLTESGAESPPWIAFDIALAEDSMVAIRDLNPDAPLTSISLSGATKGLRTDLAPTIDVDGLVLAPALSMQRVYVATFEGVDEIDISVPSKRNVSEVDETDPLVFSQVRALAFDPVNNRVIVGDEALDTLVGIDVTTGARSEFLSRKVGTGTALIAPRAFAISADGTRAWVGDDGDNAPEKLFEIDLATGDRRVIGDISQPFSTFVSGLALDEAGKRVFVAFPELILEVDLETEEAQPIASVDGSTDLESISGLVLDAEAGRLLVGDVINDGVYAVDLVTRDVTAVSQAGLAGEGPAFGGVISMTRVTGTPDLYVAADLSGLVTRVNLETGDREELVTGCDFVFGAPTFQSLQQVLYNESLHELLISADGFHSFDLDTGVCTGLPQRLIPLEIGVTPSNQLMAIDFRALIQMDRATGEVVIVSK